MRSLADPSLLDVPESLPESPAAMGVLSLWGGGGGCRPLRLHLPSCFPQFLLRLLLRVVASAELSGAASGLQAHAGIFIQSAPKKYPTRDGCECSKDQWRHTS